jgi:transposase
MAQPIAPDYGQQFLLPPALEDWVPLDHPARFLREFADQLDLPALGFVIPAASEGRPPCAPSLLLKIWLYGYFHRLRATRKLEVACREHLALLWLTGMIAPDHNSLWRFWHENDEPSGYRLPSQRFACDPQARTVTCPQGRQLDHEGRTIREGQRVERYRCHCRDCPVRAQCTRDPKGRQVKIWPHTAVGQALRAKWQEPPGQTLCQQRSQLIERRFGQSKQHDGFRRWTVWGLEAVRTQWSLPCPTLNLRILYKRGRQDRPAGPKTTAAMTGRAANLGIFRATISHQIQQMQDGMGRIIERRCGWLPICATP